MHVDHVICNALGESHTHTQHQHIRNKYPFVNVIRPDNGHCAVIYHNWVRQDQRMLVDMRSIVELALPLSIWLQEMVVVLWFKTKRVQHFLYIVVRIYVFGERVCRHRNWQLQRCTENCIQIEIENPNLFDSKPHRKLHVTRNAHRPNQTRMLYQHSIGL